MRIKRFNEAEPYEAPNHFDMRGMRLQGFEEGGPENFWVGCSHFLPGGGAGPDASPLEKVYVIVEGELTVEAEGQTAVLGKMDSITIGADIERRIVNQSNSICTMLVIMPYPEKAS